MIIYYISWVHQYVIASLWFSVVLLAQSLLQIYHPSSWLNPGNIVMFNSYVFRTFLVRILMYEVGLILLGNLDISVLLNVYDFKS